MDEFPRVETQTSVLTEFFENSSLWRDIVNVLEMQIDNLHLAMEATNEQMLDVDGINDARGRIAQMRAFSDIGTFLTNLRQDQQEQLQEKENDNE